MRIGKLIPVFLLFTVLAACAPKFTPVITPTVEAVNPIMAAITLVDNGSTFNFAKTERFSIHLDDTLYPLAEFICSPQGIIGMVSNGSALGPGVYPVTYEGVKSGSCTCVDRDFSVDIVIQ
jgi:hypothetical protein